MTKIILFLGLIALVAFLYINKAHISQTLKPQAENTATQSSVVNTAEAVVSIDSLGFTPATIEVSKGTTITFNNTDSVAHILNATKNQENSPLAQLDDAGAIQPDSSLSIILDKTGTFSYFDTSNPKSLIGTVVVK